MKNIMNFPQKTAALLGIASVALILLSNTNNERADKTVSETEVSVLSQQIMPVNLDRQWYFSGESVPLNVDTKERLHRELIINSYLHSATLLNILNSTRYFPAIEKILKEEGVPEDFKYLAIAESNLRNAVSPAGAKGVWQFMSAAASEQNLEISDEVDERYHLEKSTRAAAKYIKQLYNKFGSWTNAAAAYNIGPGRLSKLMQEQGESNYYDLELNQETARYVFRIIAIKEVVSDPLAFGYRINMEEKYPPLDNYIETEITESITNLGEFAKKHNTSYRLIKFYNPWLLSSKLTVKNKKYILKIPTQI
jgi:membrane-bound lytic murein transglycosylase D